MPRATPSPAYQRIYAIVRLIPAGRVATYGQVASLAGLPRQARQVGYALHALAEGSDVPWQRVVNARGTVSPRADSGWEGYQRFLLEEEGVSFSGGGQIDLDRWRWDPKSIPVPARRSRARRRLRRE
ncbi:MAG: MGMT family protein [Acidobacteriota bacterium]|nr:MGMT family protein [Acidobacteriota bacterium]